MRALVAGDGGRMLRWELTAHEERGTRSADWQSQLMLLTCKIYGLKLQAGTRKGSQPEDSRQSSRRASCARSSVRHQAQPGVPPHAGTKPPSAGKGEPERWSRVLG